MKAKSNQIIEVIRRFIDSPELIQGTIQREGFYYFMTQEEFLWSIGQVDSFIELHLARCNYSSLTINYPATNSASGDYFIFSSKNHPTKLFHDLFEIVQSKAYDLDETLNQLTNIE